MAFGGLPPRGSTDAGSRYVDNNLYPWRSPDVTVFEVYQGGLTTKGRYRCLLFLSIIPLLLSSFTHNQHA